MRHVCSLGGSRTKYDNNNDNDPTRLDDVAPQYSNVYCKTVTNSLPRHLLVMLAMCVDRAVQSSYPVAHCAMVTNTLVG